jgi:hydroxyethylthiazole kinase-like uncharacterized protein yjeF
MSFEWIADSNAPRCNTGLPLFSAAQIRNLEQLTAVSASQPRLMEAAGLAVARWALALAPHAQSFWIVCGNGNNGGDGAEAAIHLRNWAKTVHVTALSSDKPPPADAYQAWARLAAAGIARHEAPPEHWDVCIDALVGIGLTSPPTDRLAALIDIINRAGKPILCVDVPSGLNVDTGSVPGAVVKASATLSLLGLKPGLFTHQGRDVCGDIWLHTLGVPSDSHEYCGTLNPAPRSQKRAHDSHKGSYGDVAIVGGAPGMQGAAILAASAALFGGAGRVYVCMLGKESSLEHAIPADLMLRRYTDLPIHNLTMVVGCGGGESVQEHLEHAIHSADNLVLDADALNTLSRAPSWISKITARAPDSTILTPHPLEAARLLGSNTAGVQAHRLESAQALADIYRCTVILKGSGSIIAAPGRKPRINPSGNARLAVAGTGDVLAGLCGALLAQRHSAWQAASEACYLHGQMADEQATSKALSASRLLDLI